jgi:predicted transcriptional regulator
MASSAVAVRLNDEVISELQKIAAAQNKKVSDVVKDLITSGLQRKATAPAQEVIERLDALEKLTTSAIKAAAKAQFLANMSASFSSDVARLMTTNRQPTKEEKNVFMEQMDGWAEDFAREILEGQ